MSQKGARVTGLLLFRRNKPMQTAENLRAYKHEGCDPVLFHAGRSTVNAADEHSWPEAETSGRCAESNVCPVPEVMKFPLKLHPMMPFLFSLMQQVHLMMDAFLLNAEEITAFPDKTETEENTKKSLSGSVRAAGLHPNVASLLSWPVLQCSQSLPRSSFSSPCSPSLLATFLPFHFAQVIAGAQRNGRTDFTLLPDGEKAGGERREGTLR
ncbi:uncharacterized [Tachysurus ichikawai]